MWYFLFEWAAQAREVTQKGIGKKVGEKKSTSIETTLFTFLWDRSPFIDCKLGLTG